jgi:hypothetical protein
MTWADFDILKTSGPLNGLVKQNSVEHWCCCLRKENNLIGLILHATFIIGSLVLIQISSLTFFGPK